MYNEIWMFFISTIPKKKQIMKSSSTQFYYPSKKCLEGLLEIS